jgi:hypothetical protein
MGDKLDEVWNSLDDGSIDHQEPACEWNEAQIEAVENFKLVFGITHPRHDYYQFKDHSCMVVRFTRTPRGDDNQFYVVDLAVNDLKAATSTKPGESAKGIYLLLDGQKISRKNLSPEQQNAIIQLYNSIKVEDSES